MRVRRGFSLLETLIAIGIFAVILAVSFLPFKMLRDSYKKGGGRIDTQESLRAPVQRMIREIRKGSPQKDADDMDLPLFADYGTVNGYTGYRRINFRTIPVSPDPTGNDVSYYWRTCTTVDGPLAQPTAGAFNWPTATLVAGDPYGGFDLQPTGQPREWALVREEKQDDGKIVTRALIPRGIQVFLFQYANPSGSLELPTVLVQVGALPADAPRPLPDPALFSRDSRRLELGTTFTLRNTQNIP